MRRFSTHLILLLLLTWSACGKPGPTKSERIDAFNDNGWTLFGFDEFDRALENFLDGLNLDGQNLSGIMGEGWSRLMLGDADLDSIVASLENGTTSAEWRLDAWCGLSAVALSDQRYADADSLAARVFAEDSSYVFIYRPQVTWEDLLIIQAQARYVATDYAGSWQALLLLTAGTIYETIDPADNTTWIIGTQLFTLFEELLAKVISALADEYRWI
ncbi:MAG: hypothetical protein IH971_02905 [Candidatus Marinimicrobia bacterium]|nr:hypothetical protein [Candidatus Neomarinimicrobiota bacterium]